MDKIKQCEESLLTYVRGKSNIVQVYDGSVNDEISSVDYSLVLKKPIKGFHAILEKSDEVEEKKDRSMTGICVT